MSFHSKLPVFGKCFHDCAVKDLQVFCLLQHGIIQSTNSPSRTSYGAEQENSWSYSCGQCGCICRNHVLEAKENKQIYRFLWVSMWEITINYSTDCLNIVIFMGRLLMYSPNSILVFNISSHYWTRWVGWFCCFFVQGVMTVYEKTPNQFLCCACNTSTFVTIIMCKVLHL